MIPPASLLLWLLAANLVAFLSFGWDKRQARDGGRRTAEATLLRLAIAGGTLGAYAGRRLFRHKTRKQPFSSRLHLIAVVQAGIAFGWLAAGIG